MTLRLEFPSQKCLEEPWVLGHIGLACVVVLQEEHTKGSLPCLPGQFSWLCFELRHLVQRERLLALSTLAATSLYFVQELEKCPGSLQNLQALGFESILDLDG